MSDYLAKLTTTPPSDENFKGALEDAPLEDLNEAFEAASTANQKTRFNAIRAEIKRRYKESSLDPSDIPTWDEQKERAKAKEIGAQQDEAVKQRARDGNAKAITYCLQNGLVFATEAPAGPAVGPPAVIPSKALVPAGTKPLTLAKFENLGPSSAANPTILSLRDEILNLHAETGMSFARGLVASALCGKAATELKRQLKHGEWGPFMKEFFEPFGLAERTVQEHMAVWDAAKSKALKSADAADLLVLMNTPFSEMNAAQLKELQARAKGICEGETARGLIEGFGFSKADKKRKGGATTKGDDDGPAEKPADWSQEDWDRYTALPPEQREAVDRARPRIDAIHELGDPESSCVPHLPARERKELEAAHRRLGELLSSLK